MQTVQKIYNTDLPHRAVSVYVYLCGRAGTEPVLVRCCLMHFVQAATGNLCRPLPQALGGKSPARAPCRSASACRGRLQTTLRRRFSAKASWTSAALQ